MRWPWMRVREHELILQLEKSQYIAQAHVLAETRAYLLKCERLVDFERERADSERQRADRINDAVLQQNGLPVASSVGVEEEKERAEKSQAAQDQQMKEMREISADVLGGNYTEEGFEIPEAILEGVKSLLT